jgi:hypothetical protein
MGGDPGGIERLLAAAARGNTADWGDLLERHRARLRRMLALRPNLLGPALTLSDETSPLPV